MTFNKCYDIIIISKGKEVIKMDVWKDLYYDCLLIDINITKKIEKYQKAILRLQKEKEENRKFFKENFDLTLDKCANMSYNEYIKRKESGD